MQLRKLQPRSLASRCGRLNAGVALRHGLSSHACRCHVPAEKRPDGLTRADGSSGAAGLAERLAGAARALAEPRIALPVAVAVTGVAAAALVLWRRDSIRSQCDCCHRPPRD